MPTQQRAPQGGETTDQLHARPARRPQTALALRTKDCPGGDTDPMHRGELTLRAREATRGLQHVAGRPSEKGSMIQAHGRMGNRQNMCDYGRPRTPGGWRGWLERGAQQALAHLPGAESAAASSPWASRCVISGATAKAGGYARACNNETAIPGRGGRVGGPRDMVLTSSASGSAPLHAPASSCQAAQRTPNLFLTAHASHFT